jgi:hypothetical protein
MRTMALCLLLALLARAEDPKAPIKAADDQDVEAALQEFEEAFKSRELETKQNAVFDLHDFPHDRVIARIEKLLKDKRPEVRNVAALAMGGQGHNTKKAGVALMKSYNKDFKNTEVLASILEAMGELKYMGYWPTVEKAMKDARNSVVIRILELLGNTKDYRSLPKLLELYHVALPKRVNWSTGVVNVDTGTAGDADQKAAEAKFNAKYGRGGSKMKAKAKAKARAFDERNFGLHLRRCVKSITGESFDTALDFEDWYVEHYIEVHRKIAETDGKDPDVAEARARAELPALKAKVESDRKKLEAELEAERKARAGGN